MKNAEMVVTLQPFLHFPPPDRPASSWKQNTRIFNLGAGVSIFKVKYYL